MIFWPARTGSGVGVIVTQRSAVPATVTSSDGMLFDAFGSLVPLETFAVAPITVPPAVPESTLTMNVKVWSPSSDESAARVTEIAPVPPGPGAETLQPTGASNETKVVFIGVADEDSTPPVLPAGEAFSPGLMAELSEAVLPDRGRGLLIVQRLAVAVWWTPEERGGKTVWCRFDVDGGTSDRPD